MNVFELIILAEFISTLFYTFVGLVLLWVAWKVLDLMTPFSIVKEIEEDQNSALAILVAAVFLSISIIIGAVILS